MNTEAFAKLNEEMKKDPLEEFEIVFENTDVTLEDSSRDGGAITESYETPTIKINKK